MSSQMSRNDDSGANLMYRPTPSVQYAESPRLVAFNADPNMSAKIAVGAGTENVNKPTHFLRKC